MSNTPKKHVEAGRAFRQIRENAGFIQVEEFLNKAMTIFGHLPYSYAQINRLELGYKTPTISHFRFYQAITQCDVSEVMKMPGLLEPAT